MLDDRYFKELGEPPAARFERLPIWARVWILSMRVEAAWWHALAHGRQRSRRRVVSEPPAERIQRLPLFAIEWINTLKFEVYWWRSKAFKRLRPMNESSPSLFEVGA